MFHKRLNSLRKEKHVTAKQMAEVLEVSLRTYRYYESGSNEPSFATLVKIADYFDVSLDYLFGRDDFLEKHK